MRAKGLSKVFVKDLNVERFGGIFSAIHCWPQQCEESGDKCWSRVMCQFNDHFMERMWTQVVTKIPIITGERQSARRFNELFCGLILQELDLLSSNETDYFESILDLFDGEITFGVIFWLKVCHQFNWRLIYGKLIAERKYSQQIIEAIVDEIDVNAKQKCFTAEEISYFYSIVDCACFQWLTEMVIEDKSCDKTFFEQMRDKCCQRQSELKFDSFHRHLYEYNILTQELITFALTLSQRDCLWGEDFRKQINCLEGLLGSASTEVILDIELTRITSEDIRTARDNHCSFDVVNEYLHSVNNLKLDLASIDKFYQSFNGLVDESCQSFKFDRLRDVLEDKQNPNYNRLIEALLVFADFDTFGSILFNISPKDITNEIVIKLAERVLDMSWDSESTDFFEKLLVSSLRSADTIDLKRRAELFRDKKIMEPNIEDLKTLLNQIIKEEDAKNINRLSKEVLIAAYLSPFSTFNLLLNSALHHNKAQMDLVARLVTNELAPLSAFCSSSEYRCDTFLIKFFDHLLLIDPTLQMVDVLTKFIDNIIKCQSRSADNSPPVLLLDDVFFYFVKDQYKMKVEVTWVKFNLVKKVLDLTGDEPFAFLDDDPVPTLVFLLQFLDYFWQSPQRKQMVVQVLNEVLDKKMTRNLNEDEFSDLRDAFRQNLKSSRVGKASHSNIYIAYCEKRLPRPLSQIIDFGRIFHDQILHYATTASDFMFLCEVYPRYNDFETEIKIAVRHILPALTAAEIHRLFLFLQMYFFNHSALNIIRAAIFQLDRNIDNRFMIQTLMDVANKELIIPIKNEVMERPLTREDFEYTRMDLIITFKTLACLEFSLLPKDMTLRLKDMLVVLAKRLVLERLDWKEVYENESHMPPLARSIFGEVFDVDFFELVDYKPHNESGLIRRPAGMQCQQ